MIFDMFYLAHPSKFPPPKYIFCVTGDEIDFYLTTFLFVHFKVQLFASQI